MVSSVIVRNVVCKHCVVDDTFHVRYQQQVIVAVAWVVQISQCLKPAHSPPEAINNNHNLWQKTRNKQELQFMAKNKESITKQYALKTCDDDDHDEFICLRTRRKNKTRRKRRQRSDHLAVFESSSLLTNTSKYIT